MVDMSEVDESSEAGLKATTLRSSVKMAVFEEVSLGVNVQGEHDKERYLKRAWWNKILKRRRGARKSSGWE